MAETDPFRLRVLKRLTERLKDIAPDNGYRNDLSDQPDGSERVFRGRDQFGFSDPRPMISILEHPAALDALLSTDASPSTKAPWQLIIQGWVEDDPLNPTDPAHILAADVVVCLSKVAQEALPGDHLPTNILGFGHSMPCVNPNGRGVQIGSPVVRPPDGESSDVANFYLLLTLDLIEDRERPFD